MTRRLDGDMREGNYSGESEEEEYRETWGGTDGDTGNNSDKAANKLPITSGRKG